MSPIVVAERFVWSEYPGMRPGRVYAGKPDLFKRPKGEAHLVDGPDAVETLCGVSRERFPLDFPDAASTGSSKYATPCATCEERA
ncbi:hypothetical protein [Actinomycetospora flava]|uniref:Uncharacterized protein n=1 Tax=Actinomycetospora flava TaxID=3129232 RepID=A0ABU8MAS2_9PSEU